MIDALLNAPKPGVTWLGNAGWLLAAEGRLIATDLDLHLPERMLPPFTEMAALAEKLSYLLITHAHTDHFNPDTVRLLLAHGACRVVLPESCRTAVGLYGFDERRLIFVEPTPVLRDEHNNPLRFAGGLRYATPPVPLDSGLKIQPLRALHGHLHGAVYAGAHPQDCGYVIDFGGLRLVQPGDSVLLEEHLLLRDVDVLFISPTEHNLGVEQARLLIETVRPGQVFAQHFGTYQETPENVMWTHGFCAELGEALSPEMRARYVVPEYGKVYPLG